MAYDSVKPTLHVSYIRVAQPANCPSNKFLSFAEQFPSPTGNKIIHVEPINPVNYSIMSTSEDQLVEPSMLL